MVSRMALVVRPVVCGVADGASEGFVVDARAGRLCKSLGERTPRKQAVGQACCADSACGAEKFAACDVHGDAPGRLKVGNGQVAPQPQ